ncbi:hypothetical protein HQ533_02235 [Candidatus Woesearchaeota archaeon]|nr:hypothetical protein [Candidatus Woesearchaeota archaeon]
MDYHDTVLPFLNTNKELDEKIEKLWNHWNPNGDINVESATRVFLQAASLSPNIERLSNYVSHCLLVSRKCGEVAQLLGRNYPFLDELGLVDFSKMAFKGLVEDSFYLIGGDGTNNDDGESSNPFHEILTYIQLTHMGYQDLAEGMALHFVAQEILKEEHKKDRFLEVEIPKQPNLPLDILTSIDALCTTQYLPETKENLEDALKYRIEDIKRRRNHGHPITIGLEDGGEKRLFGVIGRLQTMIDGRYSSSQLKEIYGLER